MTRTSSAGLFEGWLGATGLTSAFLEEISSIEELEEARGRGRLWVAVAPDGDVVGFPQAIVAAGYSKVTLSTFRDVPWNRPFYEKRGFRVVQTPLPPEHRRLVAAESDRGLRIDLRVMMERDLSVGLEPHTEVT